MGDQGANIADLLSELAALRARNDDLTDFLENASLALHWVGADGRILWANQAELDLLGYAPEDYVGHHITEFHVDPATIADILRRLAQRETLHNYEARLRCQDGSVRHVLITSNVRWRDDEFLHTRCFTRDITERKRYEQRLLTQYGVGRILAEATSLESAAPRILETIATQLDWQAGLLWRFQPDEQTLECVADWEPASANGRSFAEVSRRFRFRVGAGLPGRVCGSRQAQWITDLHQDGNFPRLQVASEHGFRSAFGFPVMLGNQVHSVIEFFAGHVQAADNDLLQMSASLGYQIGEFLERVHAQRQLAEREESYRVLAETASDGIITIGANSTILFANSAAARMFGYTTSELIGSDLTLLMPESLRGPYKAALAKCLQSGERRTDWHARSVPGCHRDGYEIPVEVSFGQYAQGEKRFFVGVIRDITERKQLEDNLRESAKLESLGVLAGGIAHDFNNLLTGILGNASLALEIVDQNSPAREVLEDAIEASERAANLTKQLLAYAGKGRFLVEPIDLSALVREISALIRSSIPKHVVLRLDLQQPLPQIEADATQIQQLIMNLVINGAEAIPQNRDGSVLVLTRAQELDAIQLAALGVDIAPGHYIVISVHDNGCGMDEETMGKIFDPFFTTKFTGRGLGLAAALGIVRGHNGAMKVFSSPGQGTTFRVLLPVAAVPSKPVAGPNSRPCPSGRGLVLVVDDESIVRKIAKTSLEKYGYEVITANDGTQGLERFRELQAQLKLVLLDMTMPGLSGEEALEQMRLINPGVPVVLSSGFNEVEAIRRFTGKGLAGFLQKPYTAAALAEKVHGILSEERDLAQP